MRTNLIARTLTWMSSITFGSSDTNISKPDPQHNYVERKPVRTLDMGRGVYQHVYMVSKNGMVTFEHGPTFLMYSQQSDYELFKNHECNKTKVKK